MKIFVVALIGNWKKFRVCFGARGSLGWRRLMMFFRTALVGVCFIAASADSVRPAWAQEDVADVPSDRHTVDDDKRKSYTGLPPNLGIT